MKKATSLHETEVATVAGIRSTRRRVDRRQRRPAARGWRVRRRWVAGISGYGRRSLLSAVVVAVRQD
jgi:hypothetical protein